MKIYLAGPSCCWAHIEILASYLEDQGHSIAHKWWDTYRVPPEKRPSNSAIAKSDLLGVAQCEALVVYLERVCTEGAHLEMGFALAKGKPILVIADHDAIPALIQRNIWLDLPEIRLISTADYGPNLEGITHQLELAAEIRGIHA